MTHTFRRLEHTIRLGYALGEFEAIEIVDEEGRSAIQIPTDTIPYAEELAAYIVQACNEYPALLAVLKRIIERGLSAQAEEQTRQAIAAAEPKEAQ